MAKRTTQQNKSLHDFIARCKPVYDEDPSCLASDMKAAAEKLLRRVTRETDEALLKELYKILFLPIGKTSTTELDTKEFSEFMVAIRAHIATEHKKDVALPNEPEIIELINQMEK